MNEFETITREKAISLIMKNCKNKKCIYRLCKKTNPNNYLALTVDNVFDANFIIFYWLKYEPVNVWAVDNETVKQKCYNLN